MSANLGIAYVEFEGKFTKLHKQVGAAIKPVAGQYDKLAFSQSRASKTTSLLDRGSHKLGGTLARAAKYAAVGAAAYVSIAQAKAAVSTTLDLSKATSGLNRNLGLSTNVASRWGAVAKARDIDSKSLTMSFTILSKRMVDAAHKGGPAMEAFNRLGISQADVTKGSKDFQFGVMRVAKAFGEAEGGAKRQVSAQQLLGRGYATILPLFSEGTKSLREQLGLANEFGATLSTKTNKSLMELVTAQRESKVATLGLQVAFTKALTPALLEVEKQYQDVVKLFARDDLTSTEKWEIFGKRIEHFADLGLEAFTDILPQIASKAGQWSPKIANALVEGFTKADVWGKVSLGAFLAPRLLRGKAALAGLGMTAGSTVGGGMVVGTERAITGTTMRSRLKASMVGIGKTVGYTMGFVGIASGIQQGVSTAARGGGFKETLHDSLTSTLSGASFGALDPLLGPKFTEVWDEASQKAIKEMVAASGEFKDFGKAWKRSLGGATVGTAAPRFAEILGLPGSDDWSHMTDDQKKSFRRLFQSLRASAKFFGHQGIDVPIKLKAPLSPAAFKQLDSGFTFLKRGIGTNMADINRVTTRNMKMIRNQIGMNTSAGRELAAENMRATASAIRQQMERSGNFTKAGMERIRKLIRNADLLSPSRRQAQDFGKAWADGMDHSKEVTKKGVQGMIAEAKKMPGPMRQVALQTWLEQIKQAKRSGDITTGGFRSMRSRVLSEFGTLQKGGKAQSKGLADGVIGNVSRLVNTTGSALGVFRDNVNAALESFGVKAQHFTIKTVGGGAGQKKQQGGFIVPGTGSGDSFHTALPPGSFIENREAVKALPFAKGGLMPVALEPGERAYLPPEVKAIGRRTLEARNRAVPRFQKGGSLGPEPQLVGPSGALRSLGQTAIQKVYEGAKDYIAKHRPKGGPGYTGPAFGPKGTSSYMGILMATWVRQALEYAASKGVAPQPTSGHRSHAQNVSEGRTYTSEHEFTQYPGGAVDFGGMVDPASKPKKMAVVNATRGFKYPLLAPIGFRDDGHASGTGHQLGGLIQRLASGGFAKKLVGASTYGGPADSVSGTVGSAGISLPGKMAYAELDMGKALGGLPYHFKLKVARAGKSVIAEKLDIGAGGGPVGGKHRAIDLWYQTAEALGVGNDWLGVVQVSSPDGSTGAAKHNIPKQEKGSRQAHHYGVTGTKSGQARLVGTVRTRNYTIATAKLGSFGSLPSNLDACTKELRQRQVELGDYKDAYRNEKDPEAKRALNANIKLLKGRIRALRAQRTRLLIKERTAKALKTIAEAANFKYWTAPNVGEFAKRENAYDYAQEIADQTVSLEPEEPAGGTTSDWVNTVLKPYVDNIETPAYGRVLGAEESWRGSIITAENVAGERIGKWQGQIAKLQDQIAEIQGLRIKHPEAWAKRKDLIPGMQQKMKALRDDITKTRTETLPEWEGTLGGVQGLGRTHEIVSLTGEPTNQFGGDIFDTQMTIKGLGLKVSQALASLAGSEDNSAYIAAIETLAREKLQGDLLGKIEERVSAGMPAVGSGLQAGGKVMTYAGKFHGGGVTPGPPTQESMAIVRGDEGILTADQRDWLGEAFQGSAGAPDVKVHVHGDIVSSHPDPVEVLINDRRFPAEVRKINEHEGRSEARGAGRGLARAGVFR